jgi:hypothetical protein
LGEGFAQELEKGLGEASPQRGCHFGASENSELRIWKLQNRRGRIRLIRSLITRMMVSAYEETQRPV